MSEPTYPIGVALQCLTAEEWAHLRIVSAKERRWHKIEWWNNKYYMRARGKNGFIRLAPRKGQPEVPYERWMFYPSETGRFSLGAIGDVAYFSRDILINFCETIPQFADDPNLTFEKLRQYLDGQFNPTPGWDGYPRNYHLAPETRILDVSSEAAPFFAALTRCRDRSVSEDVLRTILSRDDADRRNTQQIAIDAKRSGFEGIVYRSVRGPVDIAIARENLALFTPECAREGILGLAERLRSA